jgi:pimeloyl-ACP methyl ester carboxylesterase
VPPEAPPPKRPYRTGLWKEWRVGPELVRLGLASAELRRQPRGVGSPVVLVPGWKAPEATMGPLRRYLAWLGHDARHWGLGTNRGRPDGDTERLARQVAELAQRAGHSVALIGWSLGGVVARETARLLPGEVAQVITFGSPVVGGPSYTVGADSWGREACDRFERRSAELDVVNPIRVPVTAIFSREDEIVSWPACIDRVSPRVRHFEVWSTHVGMGIDPAVWKLIARRLAGEGGGR